MKLDLYKTCKAEYVTPRKPAFVKTKPAQYLAISGTGLPGGPEFQDAIGALYNMAFTIKMARKFAGKDYTVCKLECRWENLRAPRDQWRYELMIRTPDFITAKDLKAAVAAKLESKGPLIKQVKLVRLNERGCVQMLHVGPYDKMGETQMQLEAFATANGKKGAGRPHEIYLSDPRRVAPAKLRTILRWPVK